MWGISAVRGLCTRVTTRLKSSHTTSQPVIFPELCTISSQREVTYSSAFPSSWPSPLAASPWYRLSVCLPALHRSGLPLLWGTGNSNKHLWQPLDSMLCPPARGCCRNREGCARGRNRIFWRCSWLVLECWLALCPCAWRCTCAWRRGSWECYRPVLSGDSQ